MKNKIRILAFFGLVIVINLLFSFIDYSFDLTLDKKHSIADETQQILSSLDDIIYIKVYLDGDFPAEFKYLQSEVKNLLSVFKSIAGSNFEFEFIDPNNLVDEKEKINLFKQLVKDGLSPTDIEVRTSSSNSNQIIFPSALVYYKNKHRAVNFLKNSIAKNIFSKKISV